MNSDYYITPQEYEEAERNGIDAYTVYRRIRYLGWNKVKAIHTPKRKKTDRRKWAEVAKKNGIPYHVFTNRVNAMGWDEEKAATLPLQDPLVMAAIARGIGGPSTALADSVGTK